MIVGVIGSGSIGPDLAYGFATAVAGQPGARVFLHDIRQEALDAGMARIGGYVHKGVARGKLSRSAADATLACLVPTLNVADLAPCDYVLEAATEDLVTKRRILRGLEDVVSAECLIGFATSGLPRAQIASEARRPERCFVNHPFYPAWRSQPIEVVLSGDAALGARMLATLEALGKVPIETADVACFAADDIFCCYCAEAARIVAEGIATPAQVDAIVNGAIGGGGPLAVTDLTRGNLLHVHCLELMRDAPTGSAWFEPPPIFRERGNALWHAQAGDPRHSQELGKIVLDRILAVLLGRTAFVLDRGICAPTELNWMTRTALGFRVGLLDLWAELGADRVRAICDGYAGPGFTVSESIRSGRVPDFLRNVRASRDGDVGVATIFRPEVKNALSKETLAELDVVLRGFEADDSVRGVVLTGFGGALAGADVQELAGLKTSAEAEQICLRGQAILGRISAMTKPVVAALDGPVLGGGAELSLACHARVVGPALTMGQPEVALGITPGYGGTQRLPRLVGVPKAVELLRLGRPIGAKEACAIGWASGEPQADPVAAAKALLRSGATLRTVDPAPLDDVSIPPLDIGSRSRVIDAILVDVLRRGLVRPLDEGLRIEADGVARCSTTVDFDIGMKNFVQNGPRVPAAFLHE